MKKFIVFLLTACLLMYVTGCSGNSEDVRKPVNFYYLRTAVEYSNPESLIIPTITESEGYEKDYAHLINMYLAGPSESKLKSPFPEGTQLQELICENNRIQIILSEQMAELEGVSMMVAFACLTKTLAEMTGIQTVQIRIADHQINGEESITLSPNNFSYWDTVTADIVSP